MSIKLWEVFIVFFSAFSLGASAMSTVRYSDAELNKLKGYHCQPIRKVKTLEEAKTIIEAHQKRIGSK